MQDLVEVLSDTSAWNTPRKVNQSTFEVGPCNSPCMHAVLRAAALCTTALAPTMAPAAWGH